MKPGHFRVGVPRKNFECTTNELQRNKRPHLWKILNIIIEITVHNLEINQFSHKVGLYKVPVADSEVI